jgi:DNA-binding PadR family transcriptional regulator
MRRGDTRTGLLAALAEAPGHGYELIQRIEEKSDGAWRPSPGSVYPTLQLLEDEGLVRATERDGKRTFEITDEGRAEAERRIEAAGGPPWAAAQASSGRGALREAMGLLGLAVRQVGIAGSKEQQDATTAILTDARKRVYQLLGES